MSALIHLQQGLVPGGLHDCKPLSPRWSLLVFKVSCFVKVRTGADGGSNALTSGAITRCHSRDLRDRNRMKSNLASDAPARRDVLRLAVTSVAGLGLAD